MHPHYCLLPTQTNPVPPFLQGVIAVGGDGVFQECVMGLMEQRAQGGSNAAAAARIRVGHIPGGSTDAVACS